MTVIMQPLPSNYRVVDACQLFRHLLWSVNERGYILQKVTEEVNRKCCPRNTTVQLSTPTPTMSAVSQTDGQTTVRCQQPILLHAVWSANTADCYNSQHLLRPWAPCHRQMDRQQYDANSQSYCMQYDRLTPRTGTTLNTYTDHERHVTDRWTDNSTMPIANLTACSMIG